MGIEYLFALGIEGLIQYKSFFWEVKKIRRGKSRTCSASPTPRSSHLRRLRYPLYGFRIDRDGGLAPVTPPPGGLRPLGPPINKSCGFIFQLPRVYFRGKAPQTLMPAVPSTAHSTHILPALDWQNVACNRNVMRSWTNIYNNFIL
jgi:hypothetical protein